MSSHPRSEPTPRQKQVAGREIVAIPSSADMAARTDWRAWHLTDEADMGEGCEQGEIIRLLLEVVKMWIAECGWSSVYAGADNFVGWVESEPLVRVSPDVYLVFDAPNPPPRSWQTWRPDHPTPRFAVEIVSLDWRKDYEDGPPKYAQLGVEELVVFDPDARRHTRAERVPLQCYRRMDGAFVRCHAGDGPVRSAVLGAWLTTVDVDGQPRLRIARDDTMRSLVPTQAEARAAAERMRSDAELRAARAEERVAKETKKRAELEVELRRLRGETSDDG